MDVRPYRLCLMGRAELCDPEGRRVPLATRKALLLLAMLSLSPEGLRRTHLADSLWPLGDEAAASAGVRTALSSLRKALPKGAVLTDGDLVSLAAGVVAVPLDDEEEREFMPGFDHEWAIDHRLRLRARFVEAALARARQEGSLAWAERACAADPLCAEAAALRAEMLHAQGRAAEAVVHRDAFRARSIRELGVVPDAPSVESAPVPHPLVAAAEWALDRDPEEACALLAGTQAQWTLLPVETARSIHERVLAASRRPTPERRMVEAGRSLFAAIGGRPDDGAEAAYHEALAVDEKATAIRLAEALAYAALSKGEFPAALAWGRAVHALAETRRDLAGLGQAELTLAIIEEHAAGRDLDERIDAAVGRIEAHGSATALAAVRNIQISAWIDRGEVDRALQAFEPHRRWIDSLGGARLSAWSLHLDALIRERVGDLEGARDAFVRLREAAPAAGQCAVAMADECLARIDCRRGEYDEAATALARVSLYRRHMGTVASRRERTLMGPAVRALSERLSPADLQAAFRRARRERAPRAA